jgi:hypothetical protein
LIKFSILCLYGRIFVETAPWFSRTLWVTAAFILLVTVPQCILYIFQCIPIDSLWTEYAPGYPIKCLNFRIVIVAFGVINIITDWWILALPIPVVMGLSLQRRTKWSICSLFLVGGVVCILSIVRLLYANHGESYDPSWDFSPLSTISTAECALGILAACMPTWRPLFKFLRSTASNFLGSAGLKSSSKSGGRSGRKAYGTTTSIGRGRFFSRAQTPDIRDQINHNGMGTGMMGNKLNMASLKATKGLAGVGAKATRSDTAMSGGSMEKILSSSEKMEMQPRRPPPIPWQQGHRTIRSVREAPAWVGGSTVSPTTPTSVQPTMPSTLLPSEAESRTHARSRSPGFDHAAEARAGEARWQQAMEMEREMERARERKRESDRSRSRSRGTGGRSRERGLGLEGILVQTEVITSIEGRR